MTEPTRPKPLRDQLPTKKWLLPIAVPALAIEWALEWIDYATSQMALFHRVLASERRCIRRRVIVRLEGPAWPVAV
ncbi:MAG: hypothetical protein ACYSUI_17675 [Planctomycetota bacterium]|jgi:hypothetical protein